MSADRESRPVAVYVDDEPSLCRVFGLLLRRAGADARTFTDPEEALEFIAHNEVAVVICDYRMPEMTGLDLRGRIARDVPFFLVSGDLSVEEDLGDDARLSGVISKPFRPEDLLALLAPFLRPAR